MTPWYRELNQRNRLLMVAAAATLEPRLTVTEFAVLTVLVNQGDCMGVSRRSLLWQRGRDCTLLDREDRVSGVGVLPYTRQGIEKACKALIARGWIREDWSTTYERRDPGLTVLQLNILSVAPSWLKPNSLGTSPKDPKATPVASRSLRNKRLPAAGADGDRSKPATGTPESAADHAEANDALLVEVDKDGQSYVCVSQGKGPPAYYLCSKYSMAAAAEIYAAKVFTRLADREVIRAELECVSNVGGGRFEFKLRVLPAAKPTRVARRPAAKSVKLEQPKYRMPKTNGAGFVRGTGERVRVIDKAHKRFGKVGEIHGYGSKGFKILDYAVLFPRCRYTEDFKPEQIESAETAAAVSGSRKRNTRSKSSSARKKSPTKKGGNRG